MKFSLRSASALALLTWLSALGLATASTPQTAVITFSGLWNGVDPYTNYAVLHRSLPASYQPLMKAEPFTKPVDGGDLGIHIDWTNPLCSNHGLNANVHDHTGDARPTNDGTHHEFGGGILFAEPPCTMTFSQPVEIPSLYWTFYVAPTSPVLKNGTISVYRRATDTTPLKTVEVPYHDTRGYVWRKMTAFAGLTISKIVFDPRGQDTGLNIDDITVRAVPHK